MAPSAEFQIDVERDIKRLPERRTIQILERALGDEDLVAVRARVGELRRLPAGTGPWLEVRGDVWFDQLTQVEEARSLERARHYLKRLLKGFGEGRQSRFSDVNLRRWQEYDDLWTDSLWNIDKRDRQGQHSGHYWGNFVPQIPHQLMRRFSKAGEWVLDPFLGSGTTLIEARRLGRNSIGVELQESVARETWSRVQREDNPQHRESQVVQGDSAHIDLRGALDERGIKSVQLALLHPPYHDIIRFSDDPRCLSNAQSTDEFIEGLGRVASNVHSVLDKGRFMALVIGDKYTEGNWVPLGFKSMEKVQTCGFNLKSIIVKNFEDTLGKRQQRELWRYRALAGGFYVFKHEYIFLFQKS